MTDRETIPVNEAAKLLGVAAYTVRHYVRTGIWDFGECIPKEKTGKTQDRFLIYKDKLYKHIGKEIQN